MFYLFLLLCSYKGERVKPHILLKTLGKHILFFMGSYYTHKCIIKSMFCLIYSRCEDGNNVVIISWKIFPLFVIVVFHFFFLFSLCSLNFTLLVFLWLGLKVEHINNICYFICVYADGRGRIEELSLTCPWIFKWFWEIYCGGFSFLCKPQGKLFYLTPHWIFHTTNGS